MLQCLYITKENLSRFVMTAIEKYKEAHRQNFANKYPLAYAAGKYIDVKLPAIKKANGLTQFIVNYINWIGYRATRVSSAGRLIDTTEKLDYGVKLKVKKFIPSTTRRGTADISSTIRGRSVMWEVKVGKDRPSEHQLAEQQREQLAGGLYFFVHNPDEFFDQLDSVLNN